MLSTCEATTVLSFLLSNLLPYPIHPKKKKKVVEIPTKAQGTPKNDRLGARGQGGGCPHCRVANRYLFLGFA